MPAKKEGKETGKRKHPYTFGIAGGSNLMGRGKEDNGLIFENLWYKLSQHIYFIFISGD